MISIQDYASANVSSWAGIEDHMMKHDTAMVKDYVDDIDSLLVFVSHYP